MLKEKKKKKNKSRKRFDYFDAFERQIRISKEASELMLEAIESFTTAEALKEEFIPKAHRLENKADDVCHEIYDALLPDFVTPIDREDIVSLATNLDVITDEIEEICQCFYMYDIHFMHNNVLPMAKIIDEAIDVLIEAVHEFKDAKSSDSFMDAVIKVNDLEEEVDKLYVRVIHNLYTHDRENPVRILVWTNIFNLFESCADQTETVANLLRSVVMKNG